MTLVEVARARAVEDPERESLALAGAYSRLMDRCRALGYAPTDGGYSVLGGSFFVVHGKDGPYRAAVVTWRLDAHRG